MTGVRADRGAGEPLPETARLTTAQVDARQKRAALLAADLLDKPREAAFDQITALVATATQAPISLLTVIDGARQVFVSAHGLAPIMGDVREGPIAASYCRHVVDSERALVIADAAAHPLVRDSQAARQGFAAYLGVPVRDREGVVVASLCAVDDRPRQWQRRDLAALEGIGRLLARELENRATLRQLESAQADARRNEVRFQSLLDTAQEGIWAIDAEGLTTYVNPRMAAMLGVDVASMVGQPVSGFVLAEDLDELSERLADNRRGEAQEFEWRFRRSDGQPIAVLAATTAIRGADGEPDGALGGFLDLTERKRADARQQVLMRELAHRGRNLLSVVLSVASMSLTADRPLAEAKEAFFGRLQALGHTFGNITEEAVEGAPLDELLAKELAAFENRVMIDGPRLVLSAKIAQTFALAVHELATNAAKYGALSTPNGRLAVSWRIERRDGEARFLFDWRESGGPPASPPKRRGFGSTLIGAITGKELGCQPAIDYGPEGFRYRLDAALARVGIAVEESPVRRKLQSELLRGFYDAWAALRGEGGSLPVLKRFDRDRFARSGGLSLAKIVGEDLRIVEAGQALTERLGRRLDEQDLASDDADSMREAYLRCARRAAPCYENLRFDFGEGDAVTFERLLVPFTAGSKRVTHVAGMVVFSGA